MQIPTINPAYHVEVLSSGVVALISETDIDLLDSPIYAQLIPLIDGHRFEREIVATLQDSFDLPKCYYALMELQKQGFIMENPPSNPLTAGYWGVADWQSILAEQSISLLAVDGVPSDVHQQAQAIFAANGYYLHEKPTLKIVIADDYANSALEQINAEALAAQQTWMLMKPIGKTVLIGPIFVPSETGCWACLRNRLTIHRDLLQQIKTEQGKSDTILPPAPYSDASLQMALNLGCNEVMQWGIHGAGLVGQILSFDLTTHQTQRHILTRRPQCKMCGNPDIMREKVQAPITLTVHQKKHANSGGYHSIPPRQFLAQHQQHVSPITGIFAEIKQSNAFAEALHVYSSSVNVAKWRNLSQRMKTYMRSLSKVARLNRAALVLWVKPSSAILAS